LDQPGKFNFQEMLRTIKNINLKGKRVLVRVDYNVALTARSQISDDFRIRQSLETLKYLQKQNCKILLVSHFGRPEGKWDKKYSLRPVAKHLAKLISKVSFFDKDYIYSSSDKNRLDNLKAGEIVLLENIRFYPGEENNDKDFSQKLASLADVFVNDAFGVCHREHASTAGITNFLPSAAGLLLEKEIKIISQAIEKPKRPLVVLVGGAKTETKIGMIGRLLKKADYFLIGGALANTFLKAQGYKMGKSIVDNKVVMECRKILFQAKKNKTTIVLPKDVVVGNFKTGKIVGEVTVDKISSGLQALDIGTKTQAEFGNLIAKAKTIIWNGPMGAFEKEKFSKGTEFIYYSIAQNPNSLSIVGGGDTLACLSKEEYLKVIDHVSSGGGAMLQFIEKGTLPAIKILEAK